MCGQDLVTAQALLSKANFNVYCLLLRKETRRDKNDNKVKIKTKKTQTNKTKNQVNQTHPGYYVYQKGTKRPLELWGSVIW